MATVAPGQKGEAAYFVSEVHLEHSLGSDGERLVTLQVVTPAKAVEIGPPYRREAELRAIGQVMAEALRVGFRETKE
jgi:hypothetical protein